MNFSSTQNSNWKWGLAFGVAGTLAGISIQHFISQIRLSRSESLRNWALVGRIKKLVIYPVKSCPGIEVDSAVATPLGLSAGDLEFFRDRVFLIVDSKGDFKTLRQFPSLALLRINISAEGLEFIAPNTESFLLKKETFINQLKTRCCRIYGTRMKNVTDCGPEIGAWLDSYLDQSGLGLVYHHSLKSERTEEIKLDITPHFTPQDFGSFQDETSYMMMAEESVDYLNSSSANRLTITPERFRGSILLEDTREAFAEEAWTYVRIGHKENGPIFKTATPCFRCRVTTINPMTGEFDPNGEPLATVLKFQRSFENKLLEKKAEKSPVLGVHFGLFAGTGMEIRVGSPVYAALI